MISAGLVYPPSDDAPPLIVAEAQGDVVEGSVLENADTDSASAKAQLARQEANNTEKTAPTA